MKYTIRWGTYDNEDNIEIYDSADPEFQDKDINDVAMKNADEIVDLGVDWCNVYKDGELVKSYDKSDYSEYKDGFDSLY